MPSISVVICTRNRPDSLRETLGQIAQLHIPAEWSIELLLIDNGETGPTQRVFQEADLSKFAARHIAEPRSGQCHARNTAIREAKGQILLWTDDDVHVPTDWIERMCRPILEDRADAIAGGIIFPPHIARVLSQKPFASRRGWFASHEYLNAENPQSMIGANMAFHRRVLERVPGFDVDLGPGALGFGDDSLFSLQLKAAGFRLVSNFGVAVEHHFDLKRATRHGLLNTARGMGRSYAFIFHHWEHDQYRLATPRLAFASLRLQFARIIDRIRHKGDLELSDYLLRLEETVAFCREIRVQSKRPRKYSRRGLAPLHAPAH